MKGRTYNASSALVRPELVEIKNTIRNLKKDAEMRLTLDVEAQQSFEFLSEQVHGLRKAFSTLSDVLVEEVDLIRSEAAESSEEVQQKIEAQSKGLKAARTELTLLRSELQTGRAAMQTKTSALEERMDSMQDDLTILAQEVAKGGSAQHLLQLETVQLRSQLEEEARERRAEQDAAAQKLQELRERLDAHDADARASMQALDADLGTLRASTERQLTTHAASIDANKSKLLQCAQAIEKQWSTTKVHQQRLESIHSSSALHNQQLQERLETINKQHSESMRRGLPRSLALALAPFRAAAAKPRQASPSSPIQSFARLLLSLLLLSLLLLVVPSSSSSFPPPPPPRSPLLRLPFLRLPLSSSRLLRVLQLGGARR